MNKVDKIVYDSFSFISSDGNFVGIEIEEVKERLKEISIDFVKWIQKEDYKINHFTNSFYKHFDIYKTFSIEELFEEFNNSENK